MKKFMKFLMIALAILLPFGFVVSPTISARAITVQDELKFTAYSQLLNFVDYDKTEKRIARMAGSNGELDARDRIKNSLDVIGTNVTAVDNSTTLDGLQRFSFYNKTDDKKEISYNVIYKIVGRNSNKKVVISCNYDNYFEPYTEHYKNNTNPVTNQYVTPDEKSSEGVNASAASVATLLALAETIEENTLDFDVELVFFGAGYQNNSGANYYLQTMSKADREATMLIVDVSRIAFGDNIYYYSGEFGSSADKFFDGAMNQLKRYKSSFYGSSVDADTPLGYANAGYSDATVLFADSGLNFLHIFAGSYEVGVVGGNCEYYGKVNVLNTKDDKVDYISDEAMLRNLGNAAYGIYGLLNSDGLISNLSNNPNMAAYNVFTNTYVASWLPLLILIVLLLITVIVYFTISGRTIKYAQDHNITGVMITIDQDEDEK